MFHPQRRTHFQTHIFEMRSFGYRACLGTLLGGHLGHFGTILNPDMGARIISKIQKRSNLRPCIEAGSRKHFWMAYTEMGGDWTGAELGTFTPGGRPRARVLDTVERLSQDLTCTCPKGRRSLHIRQPCSEIPQTILMCALFKGRGVSAAEPNADC